jgi:hypothetical protein
MMKCTLCGGVFTNSEVKRMVVVDGSQSGGTFLAFETAEKRLIHDLKREKEPENGEE